MNSLSVRFDRQLSDWLNKKMSPTRKITLRQRHIFILPSKLSIAYLFVVSLMLIAAINYENSMIYLFSFWLSSIWLTSIFFTFRNLMALKIEVLGIENCQAGNMAQLQLKITPNKKDLQDLCLFWQQDEHYWLSFEALNPKTITIGIHADQRGRFIPPRLRIENRTPMGLAVAWSLLALDVCWKIYPTAKHHPRQSNNYHRLSVENGQGTLWSKGIADLSHTRPYHQGDRPRHIHWRHWARTDELVTKEFIDRSNTQIWIHWQDYGDLDIEEKLSAMCWQILEYEKQDITFGLNIPMVLYAPSIGRLHVQRCLEALADYSVSDI